MCVWGGLTPLQRSNQCILQLQPIGQDSSLISELYIKLFFQNSNPHFPLMLVNYNFSDINCKKRENPVLVTFLWSSLMTSLSMSKVNLNLSDVGTHHFIDRKSLHFKMLHNFLQI